MNEIIKEAFIKIANETEEKIEEFVKQNKPAELTKEEFLSIYKISYDLKYDSFDIGGIPKLYLDIRLKTPEEILEELQCY